MQRPLLIVSDAITGPTGLGRITRELAVRIHERLSDVIRVGTCGPGGTYSRQFGFPNYPASLSNFQIPELPMIWKDFAGDEEGIIFFIWNASWLGWVADPNSLPQGDLRTLMASPKVEKWGYFPVDSVGPNYMLGSDEIRIMSSFNRVAAYTEWAKEVMEASSNFRRRPFRCEVLFHGTDTSSFFPRDKAEARRKFLPMVAGQEGLISDDVVLLCVNQTNTPRKDWPLAFEVCQKLLDLKVNVGLWAHTDSFQKYWNLPSLADEFEMRNRTIFTNSHLSDESLSWGYAACDAMLSIGSGEGWGMSGAEMLACGRPAIHGRYAGQVQYTPTDYLVDPVAYRYDGYYACKRPVFRANDWALAVERAVRNPVQTLDAKFAWEGENGVWKMWERWFREGM